MSSSDEDSLALRFCRSAKVHKHRARVLTAGSDEENTPPVAVGHLQGKVDKHGMSFSARPCPTTQIHEAEIAAEKPKGCQVMLHRSIGRSPVKPLAACDGEHRIAMLAQPKGIQQKWCSPCRNSAAATLTSLDHHREADAASLYDYNSNKVSVDSTTNIRLAIRASAVAAECSQTAGHAADYGGVAAEGVGGTSTPSTPQAAAVLDIADPFTPWLRTACKHKLAAGSSNSSMQQEDTAPHMQQEGTAPHSPLTFSSNSSMHSGNHAQWAATAALTMGSTVSTQAGSHEQGSPWPQTAALSSVQGPACDSSSAVASAGSSLAVRLFSTASPVAAVECKSLQLVDASDVEAAICQTGWHTSCNTDSRLSAGGISSQQRYLKDSNSTRSGSASPSSSLVGNSVDSNQQPADVLDASPFSYHSPACGSGSTQHHSKQAVVAGSQTSSSSSSRRRRGSSARVQEQHWQHWQQQPVSDSMLQQLDRTAATLQAAAHIAATPAAAAPTNDCVCGHKAVSLLVDRAATHFRPSDHARSQEANNPSDMLPVPAKQPSSEILQLPLHKQPNPALPCGVTQESAPAVDATFKQSSSDEDDYQQITFSRRKPRRASDTVVPRQSAAVGAAGAAGVIGGISDTAQGQLEGSHNMLGWEGHVSCSDTHQQSANRLMERSRPLSINSSSSDDDDGSDSDGWAAGSGDEVEGSSSDFGFSAPKGRTSSRDVSDTATPEGVARILSGEHSGRVTPGSSSSLVARRRKRQEGRHSNAGCTGTPQQQQQLGCWWQRSGGMSEVQSPASLQPAADPYDFDALMRTLTPPNTIEGRVSATVVNTRDSSGCLATPCVMLSFTPAAAAAAPWTSAHPCDRTAAGAAVGALKKLSPGLLPNSPPDPKPTGVLLFHPLATPTAAGRGVSPGVPAASSAGVADSLAVPGNNMRDAAVVPRGTRPAAGAGQGGQGAGRGRKQPQAGSRTAPAKAPSSRMFARLRQQMAQQLYHQWNQQVFDGGLPPHLALVWNPRLTSTAGQVVDDGSHNRHKTSREERIPVKLELSTKVLDTETRLRTTLAHEMCHVAAWAISREFKQHHGPAFWTWASRFEERVPGIKITTCHNYDIHAPFRWQCMNTECGKQYLRHKRSIDTNKHVCSRCSGRLMFLGKFSRDGKLLSSAAGSATTGTASKTPGGNVFSQFVKTHFATTKKGLPAGTPHKEIMSRLAAQYKQDKVAAANLQQQQQPAAGHDQQTQQEHADAATEVIGSSKEQIDSIQLLSDSDMGSDEQQKVEFEREHGDLPTFMQRLNLAE